MRSSPVADRGKLTRQVRKEPKPLPFLRKEQIRKNQPTLLLAAWVGAALFSVGLAVGAILLLGQSDSTPAVLDELAAIREENLVTNRQIELQDLVTDDRGEVFASVVLPPLFGGLVGRDVSVTRLVSRYEELAVRLPVLFGAFDPLIRFQDEDENLLAQLIVGPFETMDDARLFCRTLRLEHRLPCEETRYSGETFLPR
jgi:hypothetical protein